MGKLAIGTCVFAHRPNKYAKVWNSDLGEEQVVEIERHGKGGWNTPNVKYWLDCLMPKEIELWTGNCKNDCQISSRL